MLTVYFVVLMTILGEVIPASILNLFINTPYYESMSLEDSKILGLVSIITFTPLFIMVNIKHGIMFLLSFSLLKLIKRLNTI